MIRAGLLAGLALVVCACGTTIEAADGTPIGSIAAPGQVAGGGTVLPDGTVLPEGATIGADGEIILGDGGTTTTTGGGSVPGTGTSSAPGATGTTGPVSPGAKGTGPIKVGFLTTSVSQAAQFGVSAGNTLSGEDIIKALAAGMNAEGGLSGRKIEPIIASTDTGSSSWEADFQAACSKFTEDNKVESVVGYDFVYLDSFETCLTKAGISHLTTGYDPGDSTGFQQYPYISSIYPTFDEKWRILIRAPYEDGTLTKESKIGLVVDECPAHVRAQQRELYPFIKEKDLTVAATMSVACPRGSGATASGVSAVSNAVLSFRSRGVDQVILDGVTLYFFAQTAESQGYRPGYITNGGAGLLDNNPLPEEQMKNIRSYGLDPSRDVSIKKQPPRTPIQERCIALVKKGGATLSAAADFAGAYSTCDGLFMLEAAMKRTNGTTDAAAITAAIQQLGTSFKSTEMIGSQTSFSSGDRSGATLFNVATYDTACKCFSYPGPAKRIP
ncbi:unannotated protein [freshwater metagenome]|uniref:Unannotated protein n=1 Tax=freshwater metagenome TaxID=449393 RepID=A0A6J6R128_9ZZZZ